MRDTPPAAALDRAWHLTRIEPSREKADAIVVFGAAVWSDGPSMTLRVRVARAAELYRAGLAPTILCTGGWSNGQSEAQVMRAMLVAAGVPASAVIPDDGGTNTRAALRSVKRFDGSRWRRIIAVSSPYHRLRIYREARRQDVDAIVHGAARPGPTTWRLRLYDARQYCREIVAVPVYAASWRLQRLSRRGLMGYALKGARHLAARIRFLFIEADEVAAAGGAIARLIKDHAAHLSDSAVMQSGSSSLRAPVVGTIGSRFGLRHRRLHAGVDFRVPYGSTVSSAGGGIVLHAGWIGPYGNVAIIDHGGGLATVYAHLAGFVIAKGEAVAAAQPIGYVGETGRSSGPHLHFEVRAHGSPVDPLAYLVPAIQAIGNRPSGRS